MSIGAPSKLGSILIQRLDSMLGTRVGQQTSVDSSASPKVVYQLGTAENIDILKNLPERHPADQNHQVADKAGKQNQAAIGKAMRQMDLDNLLGRQTTFKGATNSAPTTLGFGARIILALLNKFPHSNRTIQGNTPLLANKGSQTTLNQAITAGNTAKVWGQLATALNQPGANAAMFAQGLAQSIESSGLFYESHLAKLSLGKFDLNTLKQEPQAKLPSLANNNNQIKVGNKTININLPTGFNELLQADSETSKSTHKSAQSHASTDLTSTTNHSNNNSDQLQLLVRQQLEVLASQSLIWRGEAWPGVELECEIIRHPDEGNEEESNQDKSEPNEKWDTNLNIKLPKLGAVRANISLNGDNINIHIIAPQSAKVLDQSTNTLFQRLVAHGLQAKQLRVSSNPQVNKDVGDQTNG